MTHPSPLVDKLPKLVVHADWSVHPHKRWMAHALHGELGYMLNPAEPVGDVRTLFTRLRSRVGPDDAILIGFDFPIGIPAAYAQAAGIESFRNWLPQLGRDEWATFFEVCGNAAEIAPQRPFYPHAPGGKRQAHLTTALGVETMDELRRRCERRTVARGPASPLFWTLGAKQVGKGAITGWRDVLAPALSAEQPIALWPFDGDLQALLNRPQIVVAETYPAESCLHVGMRAPGASTWSKRKQQDRTAKQTEFFRWINSRECPTNGNYIQQITSGFGEGADGEDPFDAVVGLCTLLDVVLGRRSEGAPWDAEVRDHEGWILGLRQEELLSGTTTVSVR